MSSLSSFAELFHTFLILPPRALSKYKFITSIRFDHLGIHGPCLSMARVSLKSNCLPFRSNVSACCPSQCHLSWRTLQHIHRCFCLKEVRHCLKVVGNGYWQFHASSNNERFHISSAGLFGMRTFWCECETSHVYSAPFVTHSAPRPDDLGMPEINLTFPPFWSL